MNKPILLSILAFELILCNYCFLGAVVALAALEIWDYGNRKEVKENVY